MQLNGKFSAINRPLAAKRVSAAEGWSGAAGLKLRLWIAGRIVAALAGEAAKDLAGRFRIARQRMPFNSNTLQPYSNKYTLLNNHPLR